MAQAFSHSEMKDQIWNRFLIILGCAFIFRKHPLANLDSKYSRYRIIRYS